jgi:hypothetical protein
MLPNMKPPQGAPQALFVRLSKQKSIIHNPLTADNNAKPLDKISKKKYLYQTREQWTVDSEQ